MTRKTTIAALVAAGLIAAATALGSRAPTDEAKQEASYNAYKPLYEKGRMMPACFEEPTHCGLVVW
jgi:hypothetical protein